MITIIIIPSWLGLDSLIGHDVVLLNQTSRQSKQRKSIRQPRDDFDSRPTVVVVTHSIHFSAKGQTGGYQF
jgi:hypothetical protein